MAKESPEKSVVVSMDDLLNLDITAIKQQTVSGGGRGKRSAWGSLTDEQKMLVHKKILVNNKLAADFKVGSIEEVQFFVISDVPTNEKTPVMHRGQRIQFLKDQVLVDDIIVGFKQSGTGKQIIYNYNDSEIKFMCSGMSISTSQNGDKAITKCNLNPKSE